MSRGGIIVNFDDDDWSSPERIEHQVRSLLKSGKSLATYYAILFTDGVRWWRYKGFPQTNLGSSFCYFRDFALRHPFKPKQIHEDADFIHVAMSEKNHFSEDGTRYLVASIHVRNTSPKMIAGRSWKLLSNAPEIRGYEWI